MGGLNNIIGRVQRSTSGNIAVIAAITMVPVCAMIGAAVDYSRASGVEAQLQSSLDAGVLAAAQTFRVGPEGASPETLESVKEAVSAYLVSSGIGSDVVGSLNLTVSMEGSDLSATVEGSVPTSVLGIIHVTNIPVAVNSTVSASSDPIEVALSLDVTDSMAGNMGDLRSAARLFVDMITNEGRNRNAKIGLVPFVGAVNVGSSQVQSSWLDDQGKSKYNGWVLQSSYTALVNGCPPYTGGTPVGGGSSNDSGWLGNDFTRNLAFFASELVGIGPAEAHEPPYNFYQWDSCNWGNPPTVNHTRLWEQLPSVKWKGCVEARPEPNDVNDTPPQPGKPNTLWVRYFWPDGVDPNADTDWPNGPNTNNYISDDPFVPNSDMERGGWGRSFSVMKYRPEKLVSVDETPPQTRGPNRACPDPILPLTNQHQLLIDRIAALQHWEGSGTNTAEGVAWGWRVLSPTAPFTEGARYGEVSKILVLMSDGKNMILRDDDSPFGTDYSSYGSIRYGRFPSDTNVNTANDFLDERMALACTNAKNAGIEIYVVSLGITNAHSRQLLNNCASDLEHVIQIDRDGSLTEAFAEIAAKIQKLRLTK
jgi:Flp pilus assembly protein TadG